jgi:hypothetical protein
VPVASNVFTHAISIVAVVAHWAHLDLGACCIEVLGVCDTLKLDTLNLFAIVCELAILLEPGR